MNYLAHILLSHPDNERMLGNFLGDFVRTKQLVQLPSQVKYGVHLHREIDRFTDAHFSFRKVVEHLRPSLGKYAPVALDIVNDHLLSINWELYSHVPLRIFCDGFYVNLKTARNILPEKLEKNVDIMLEHDFLMSTSNSYRLFKSLEHMDRRATFNSNFVGAHKIMEKDFSLFEEAFISLMNDLVAFCNGSERGI